MVSLPQQAPPKRNRTFGTKGNPPTKSTVFLGEPPQTPHRPPPKKKNNPPTTPLPLARTEPVLPRPPPEPNPTDPGAPSPGPAPAPPPPGRPCAAPGPVGWVGWGGGGSGWGRGTCSQVISPTACGALLVLAPPRSPCRTSWNPGGIVVEPWWNPGGTLVEPSWNLASGPPQTTPEPIWAETQSFQLLGEKK